MPTFNVCGTLYPYPNVGDNPWGTIHINWASAVSSCLTTVNTAVATFFPNPMTTLGDMIYEDVSLAPARLPIGTTGQLLTVDVSGIPVWATPSATAGNVPIGSILPWCDFNGVLTLDVNYRYCDGDTIIAGGSPIDGLATDDLSGAYIVGYGTLGAGDIGTATYSTAPVGNALNEIAINHTHTMSHTHPGPSHTHTEGTFVAQIGWGLTESINVGRQFFKKLTTTGWTATAFAGGNYTGASGVGTENITITHGAGINGVSGASGTANTGAASTATTSSGLSATQSIQPRSQRYRYIIRVL